MIKPILYGSLGFVLAATLAGAGYYAGRNVTANPVASRSYGVSAHAAPTKPKIDVATAHIIGVWALADSGCATGYGAGYSDDGRFSEGDEFSGVEGRWRISGLTLIRDTVLRYETNDNGNAPKAHPVHQVDKFPIIRLTDNEFTIEDQGQKFSYVKCPEGRRILMDGGEIG